MENFRIKYFLPIGAFWGFISVLMDALADHAAIFQTIAPESLMTAIRYNMVYAVLITVLSVVHMPVPLKKPIIAFTSGSILFSGGIYLAALTGISIFAYATPVGGLLLMIGWIILFFYGLRYSLKKIKFCF